MAFCANCGHEMSDAAVACPNCGHPHGQPAAMGASRTGPRASFGERLLAALIDGAIFLVPLVVLSLALRAFGYFLVILASLAYYVYLEGSPSGQTVGKKVMNIRIVDADTGGPIGYGRGAIRLVGRWLSGFLCGLGYWWMLWDPNKQTWADKIANTVVVPTAAYPVAAWPG
jgi:uncharacterized RDD family membrane protein YckC